MKKQIRILLQEATEKGKLMEVVFESLKYIKDNDVTELEAVAYGMSVWCED